MDRLNKMNKKEIIGELQKRGLATNGRKSLLKSRLRNIYENSPNIQQSQERLNLNETPSIQFIDKICSKYEEKKEKNNENTKMINQRCLKKENSIKKKK